MDITSLLEGDQKRPFILRRDAGHEGAVEDDGKRTVLEAK
jgi:hypothetical protein